MTFIWHNGIFKNDEPVLENNDRLRLGDGVFDTMLAVDGRSVFSDLHFQRLMFHASVLGISYDIVQEVFEHAAHELLQRNAKVRGQAVIRTILTRGPAEGGIKIPVSSKPQIIMRVGDAPEAAASFNVTVAQNVRRNEGSPLSRIKSINYGDQILAMQEATFKGADDCILLNNKNFVTCATAGNIFAVLQGQLFTPPAEDGVMEGILRGKIMDNYRAKERSLTYDDLMNSEGLYITNSVRGAVEISMLDGKIMPSPTIKIDPALHLG